MMNKVVGLIVLLFYFSISCKAEKRDTLILGTINSFPFTQRELELSNANYKCLFSNQKVTFEALAEVKVQQLLALELGLIPDFSYKYFHQQFLNENKRRREALFNSKVFYGPVQFSEESYFSYYTSNLVLNLKKELAKTRFKIDQPGLLKLYEQNKDSLYKIPDRILCIRAEIKAENADSTQLAQTATEMESMLTNNSLVSIVNPNPDKVKVSIVYQNFNPETDLALEKESYFEFAELTKEIKTGELLKRKTGKGKYEIIKIIEKKKSGYRSFDSVKNSVISIETDLQYINYIKSLLKKAIIVQF